jgi:hypothetical protein
MVDDLVFKIKDFKVSPSFFKIKDFKMRHAQGVKSE